VKTVLILSGSAALLFLIIDLIWLTVVAKELYQAEIGSLLKKEFNGYAAFAFYTVFIAGLTLFVLVPAFEAQSLMRALLLGAAFGFVTYATYDLTNLATLQGFTTRIAIIDMAWGTTLTALVSLGAVFTALRLG
jgi:uncharacterized membrane protein